MSTLRRAWSTRPLVRAVGLLAALAYLPVLRSAPGRMPADSKLYLYLDPGRFLSDAAGSFDPRQFAGWVPHQHIAYLWPAGPWFWICDQLGLPEWVAHRLWLGSLLFTAGLGVWWCVRTLGLSARSALVAAVVYQTSLYVLPYVSRTSVMLLPWAGLPWIVGFTIRSTRRSATAGRWSPWRDPAAIALIVLTVGAVNATALAMIVPAPVLWLAHASWQRSITWRRGLAIAARVAGLSIGVSLWWVVMLMIHGRFGADVLPYSETLGDVARTSTSAEVWRGLGYWLFYVRDPFGPTTSASLRYLTSGVAVLVSFVVPIAAVAGLLWTRWAHRRFAAMLIATGVVLAVGVHPSGDRSPLMSLLTGGADDGLALALRSSTRAVPVLMLGVVIALAALIDGVAPVRLPSAFGRRPPADVTLGVVIVLIAVVNLPALWTGAFVDPVLERDEAPPPAWIEAAAALDATGSTARVLQLPGAEFGAFRWGYTVDQPLPGLSERHVVTRDLLPAGSPAAMDLLYALDDRIQSYTLDGASLAPVARLLGVDTIMLTNDQAYERFRTARPEVVRDLVAGADGLSDPVGFGPPFVSRPLVAMTDERALGDPRVGGPMPAVELVAVDRPGGLIRVADRAVLLAGSGDGVVDAAAAGLIDGSEVIRYSASITDDAALREAAGDAVAVVVTDSNRSRARHWRGSQDTAGLTEHAETWLNPLDPATFDARLPVFGSPSPAAGAATAEQLDAMTLAEQRGLVTATATSYGERFAYLPEYRPVMALDGDLDTAWLVGEHDDPVGQTLRLYLSAATDTISVVQAVRPGGRRIADVSVSVSDAAGRPPAGTVQIALDERSLSEPGQPIEVPSSARVVDLTIRSIEGGADGTVSPVGFAEVATGLGPTLEVVRPPRDAIAATGPDTPLALVFGRLRSDPMNRWRQDPEPVLARAFETPWERTVEVSTTVRVDARAADAQLAAVFDWPVAASTRLTGSVRNAGVAAFDGDARTAWVTAFGQAQGATLSIFDRTSPTTSIVVRQPISGFSRVAQLELSVGAERRTVALVPDAGGVATAELTPPLPPGPLTITLTGIESQFTIDRRFGDRVELPAAISEVTIDDGPSVPVLGTVVSTFECVPLATLDGRTIRATIDVAGAAWLDGEPIRSTPCTSRFVLPAGAHELGPADAGLPVTLDGLVLDAGAARALGDASAALGASASVERHGRYASTIEVSGCTAGCWLVFGQGYSAAWSASAGGRDLGPQVLLDGGFNGWWLRPSTGATEITVRWTAQVPLTAALIVSLVTAVGAIGLVLGGRALGRRHDDRGATSSRTGRPAVAPRFAGPAVAVEPLRIGVRRAALGGAMWVALAALLIGPPWALAGALGGLTLIATRRARLAELTALSCLVTVAAAVVALEHRDAPFPGAGWPTAFTSVHGVGLFAVVSILVGVIVADDASCDPVHLTADDA